MTQITIQVPICIDCNKPHFGKNNVEDRCVCDSVGRRKIGTIVLDEIDRKSSNDNPQSPHEILSSCNNI